MMSRVVTKKTGKFLCASSAAILFAFDELSCHSLEWTIFCYTFVIDVILYGFYTHMYLLSRNSVIINILFILYLSFLFRSSVCYVGLSHHAEPLISCLVGAVQFAK